MAERRYDLPETLQKIVDQLPPDYKAPEVPADPAPKGKVVEAEPPKAVELRKEGMVVMSEKTYADFQIAPNGYYWHKREQVERVARHLAGVPLGIAVGIIDAAVESVFLGVSEVAEDVSFGVARTIKRTRDGWNRGWQ